MRSFFLDSLSKKQWAGLVERPAIDFSKIVPRVKKILDEVKKKGDKAVKSYTEKFDQTAVKKIAVSQNELEEAFQRTSSQTKRALRKAAGNILKFHKSQLVKEKKVETSEGIKCWREIRAIEKVGLYVPKGLVSTVLMLAVPAKLAGCQQVLMAVPPEKSGSVADEMLAAAQIAGVSKVFKMGGAQAIAAMAYGTSGVPKVDKIFGPGNQYVTTAKMLVSIDPQGAAIDLPAGPSEVLVIADERANPVFVAADLLSQAEHGRDSQVVLISLNPALSQKVKKELEKQLAELPQTRRVLAQSTLKNSLLLETISLKQAIDFANLYAPEHLILNFQKAQKYIFQIKNAGSVFVGALSPESAGDYASGTNHVLPTNAYAKSCSGLSVDSFVKKITFQSLTKTGLTDIRETVETLADLEQMSAHKKAVLLRTG